MLAESIELDLRVLIALDVYDPSKRAHVLSEIYKLVDDPANRRPIPSKSPEDRLYLADMPNGLRVIFRTDDWDRVIEIVDFFRLWRSSTPESATIPAGPVP